MFTVQAEENSLRNNTPGNMQNDIVDCQKIKNDLLKMICHELRTPVSAVIGFTEILKDSESSDDNMSILDTMLMASKKIRDLSDSALLLTQIDPEKIGESMRPTKISSIIEYAITDVNEEYTGKYIRISTPATYENTEIVIEPGLIKEVIKIILATIISSGNNFSTIKLKITENTNTVVLAIGYTGNERTADQTKKLKDCLTGNLQVLQSDLQCLRLTIAHYILKLHNAEVKILENTGYEAEVNMIFPINFAKRNALNQLLSQLN